MPAGDSVVRRTINEQISALFRELADLPRSEREMIFLARKVAPELRAQVESLLACDSEGHHLLTECIGEAAESAVQARSPGAGEFCGPYRLLRLLGSGGMGAVYLAERRDGEIQQRAAIKMLLIGAERPAWQERFLRERQLLANLNHPSVARLLDAGRTDRGQPYLVMEYVDGAPIDASAAGKGLREQLGLFLKVCEGVAHAHRHLIIHRDLKPSNILVDRSGQPKLLDFGIAKLLDETGEQTQTAERLLTPHYASPEQIRGGMQTTATDVYSLAAVLYKIVTGRSPHQSETGQLQAIDIVAGTREIPAPRRLNPALPSDIESILQKALRREPEQRYVSVEAFASDIRAFLESRPVEARSGDAWYRARKFLRRYWGAVMATALVTASLSAGVYIANRERALAEGRFQQLRQLAGRMFDLDRRIQALPGSTDARHDLATASLAYLEGLKFDPRKDLDLTQEVADGYWRLGRIQGVPAQLNLGEYVQAESSLKRADALTEIVLAARPNDRAALYRSAGIAQDRMIIAADEHRRADAIALARQTAERLERFRGHGELAEAEIRDLIGWYGNVALTYLNQRLYSEAVRFAERSVELARGSRSHRSRAAGSLSMLANARRYQGDLEGALRAVQEARQVAERAVYENPTVRAIDLYGVLLRQGMVLAENGGVSLDRPEEAMIPLREALELNEQMARQDPKDYASRTRVGTAALQLGNVLCPRDPRQALAVYDLGIRRLNEIRNNLKASRDRAILLAGSSYALRRLNRGAEARRRVEEALAILKETKDYPAQQAPLGSEVVTVLRAQADDEAAQGNPARAGTMYEELLQKILAAKPRPLADLRDAAGLSQFYEGFAAFRDHIGQSAEAEAINRQRRELWQNWDRKLPHNSFVLRQMTATRTLAR